MKPFSRSDRVAGQIQKALSDLLKKRVHDPRLSMTTITGVKVSSDLRIARIYFIAPGGQTGRNEASQGFECAAGFVKRTLARRLALRYMPELKFFYDESFDYGAHIDRLLELVKKENETDHRPSEQ